MSNLGDIASKVLQRQDESNPLVSPVPESTDSSPSQSLGSIASQILGQTSPVGTDYIAKRASQTGLDPRAVIGVARHEGLSGAVGDNGTSFGPFQLHAGGALPPIIWQKGPDFAQQWAWSPEGIDYALNQMAQKGARGLTGSAAVEAIVKNFERPADPTGDLQSGYQEVGGNP